jgi:2-succinyl-6-hydroxy-2,4-cyclohexadiene-1-carboxylate synthase
MDRSPASDLASTTGPLAVHRSPAGRPPARRPADEPGDPVPRSHPLVLVHGFTQTSACWSPVDDALAATHDLVRVDAPGHGGSTGVRLDLVAGGEAIAAAGGAGTYLGYSMGGRFCLHTALSRPDLVERLVLVSATAGIDDPRERSARRTTDERLADHLLAVGVPAFVDEWLALPLFSGLPPERAHRAARLESSAEGLASSLRLAGTGTQLPLWDRLGELAMPVLVVAGAGDAKFVALAERLAAAIGPGAELAVVDDAGHTVHLEQPERFLTVLLAWLSASDGAVSRR